MADDQVEHTVPIEIGVNRRGKQRAGRHIGKRNERCHAGTTHHAQVEVVGVHEDDIEHRRDCSAVAIAPRNTNRNQHAGVKRRIAVTDQDLVNPLAVAVARFSI